MMDHCLNKLVLERVGDALRTTIACGWHPEDRSYRRIVSTFCDR